MATPSSTRRNLFSSIFSLAIIGSTLFVTQRFILPLLWAAILCIATWPLFLRMLRACRGHHLVAAAVTTLISALVFVTPLVLGIVQAAHQAPALAAMVANANTAGIGAPQWLLHPHGRGGDV
jgi:predicted PurR-regulated permease PerM